MRLRFGSHGFRGELGDERHGFRSYAVGGQDNVENTRIRRICLFLENRFPCLCEASTKDEVNMTTLVFGIRTYQTSFVHLDLSS